MSQCHLTQAPSRESKRLGYLIGIGRLETLEEGFIPRGGPLVLAEVDVIGAGVEVRCGSVNRVKEQPIAAETASVPRGKQLVDTY